MGEITPDTVKLINAELAEADRLQELLSHYQDEKFELLEGEYLAIDEKRDQISKEHMGSYLMDELANHNETYSLLSSTFNLLKNRQPSDQKYE